MKNGLNYSNVHEDTKKNRDYNFNSKLGNLRWKALDVINKDIT